MNHREGPAERPAIPDDNAPVAPARRPTRWTVRRVRSIAYLLFGLAVAASLVSVYLTYRIAQDSAVRAEAVDRRLSVLEQDLAERTAQRDAERDQAAQEQERFRVNLCIVLGELPASPGLDAIRSTLHCPQPGVTTPSPMAPPSPPPGQATDPAGSSTPPSDPPTVAPVAPTSEPAPTPSAPATPSLLCELLPLC